MTTKKLTKLLALYLPYLLLGLVATNFGEAWRLAEGKELGDKILSMMGTVPVAFANPLPSLHRVNDKVYNKLGFSIISVKSVWKRCHMDLPGSTNLIRRKVTHTSRLRPIIMWTRRFFKLPLQHGEIYGIAVPRFASWYPPSIQKAIWTFRSGKTENSYSNLGILLLCPT